MPRIIALAFLLAATTAQAQTCGPHEKFKTELEKNHGEKQILILVQPNGSVLEVFANSAARTWSVLNARPNNFACMVGAGTGYIPTKHKPGEAS